MNEWNERNKRLIDEFRANGGNVGGAFQGKTLLLLHTKGARSEQERINPVMYIKDGGRWVVTAHKGGAPTNPDWYYNLLANPLVTVELGTETFQARAEVVQEPECTRLYGKLVERLHSFDEYRRKTARVIPVIVLTRVEASPSTEAQGYELRSSEVH
jgi:deazaflavin-dependent oxidoreductase (nitroreductase family)